MEKIDTISGKRILFMTPPFFGYEKLVVNKLNELGAVADYYDARSITKEFDRALIKISPDIFLNKTDKYFDEMFKNFSGKNFDYILIQNCEMMTGEILKRFRTEFPQSKIILYLCDTVGNIKGITTKFKLFDKVLSFDPEDAKTYNLLFRPLYYADCYSQAVSTFDNYLYDLCFIGTIHSDRYKVIYKVKNICKEYNKKYFLYNYLQSGFIYTYYKLTKKEFLNTKKSDFSFNKLSSSDISEIVNESRVILDIQHPKQSGLTMRTIEMLGMNKKLITTNKRIKEQDFYNKNNILVIDRNQVFIDEAFFESPYQEIKTDIYKRYSLESWLREIIS